MTLLSALATAGCVDRGEVLRPAPAATPSGENDGGGAGSDDGMPAPPPPGVVTGVALGGSHVAALASGSLFTWGANDVGQLGQGDTVERHVPTLVQTNLELVSVTAGDSYTCGLDELGDVYCFGANDRGQLGQGDRNARVSPARVPLPVTASAISGSFDHACALLADASLYCWGRNQEGELGQDDRVPPASDDTARDALTPVEVPGMDWKNVAAGDGVTCGIRFDGTLWCWGRNTSHELVSDPATQVRHPVQVNGDTDWLRVTIGQQHVLALKQDHSLWCWGENVGQPTGDGSPLGIDTPALDVPTELGTATDWVAFATRTFHSCAVNRAAQLWCWGRGIEGQLGTGDLALRLTPTHVANDIVDVDVSWFGTCALTRSGRILCTGKNDHGEIGDGTTERPLVFTDVTPSLAD